MLTRKSLSEVFGTPKNIVLLLVIILLGTILRLYCFQGFWGTDDAEYARLAHAMTNGTFCDFVKANYLESFDGPAHLPFRMALIFPLSLLFRFFGISELALVIYPLTISVLSILLAYLAGRLLFDIKAGLAASAIWAVLPINVHYSTQFRPDILVTFFASLGVLILIKMMGSESKNKLLLFISGSLAGILFSLSWLSKGTVIYLVPFCLILMILSIKKNWKHGLPLWAGVAAFSLIVIVVEMVVYHHLRDDSLFRFHEIERSYLQTKSYLFFEGSRFGWPEGGSHLNAVLKRLFLEGPKFIFLNDQYLCLLFFGAIAGAYAWFWKDRNFLIPFLWMMTTAFMFNFSSHSLSSYTPIVLYESYLLIMVFPAAVLTAGFLSKLLYGNEVNMPATVGRERIFWGLLLAALIIGIAGHKTFREIRGQSRIRAIYETKTVTGILKPSDSIYTDPLTMKTLEFFWHYPEKMNMTNFENMKDSEIPPQSFVLLDRARLDYLRINVGMWLTKDYGYHAPEFLTNPPPAWKIVWKNANAVLYRTD